MPGVALNTLLLGVLSREPGSERLLSSTGATVVPKVRNVDGTSAATIAVFADPELTDPYSGTPTTSHGMVDGWVASGQSLNIEATFAGSTITYPVEAVSASVEVRLDLLGAGLPIADTRVQHASAYENLVAFITSLAVELPEPAMAGRLLVAAVAIDKASGAIATPVGWTARMALSQTAVSLAIFTKLAEADEQAITFSWTTQQHGAGAWIAEYDTTRHELLASSIAAAQTGNVTSTAIAATGIAIEDGFAIACVGIDTATFWQPSASNGFDTVDVAAYASESGGFGPGLAVFDRPVTAGQRLAPTVSWPVLSDETLYGLVVMAR